MIAVGLKARSALAVVSLLSGTAAAEPLHEPPVLRSARGSLEILMVAREQRLSTLPGQPVGWVYEICRHRAEDGPLRRCPAPGPTRAQLTRCPGAEDPALSPYGGVRLQLEPGDVLRVRLVNCLPRVARDRPFPGEFKHVGEGGDTLLQYNPTNLHTHGLLVEPRCATTADDTYGDWVFVLAINPTGQFPADLVGRHSCQATDRGAERAGHGHHSTGLDVTADGVVNYLIRIPRDHPSGLYWAHPHAHGLALNQVAAGLAIPLTIGPMDYLCGSQGCAARGGSPRIRHLVLKDTQIMADGRLKLQEDWTFCGRPDPADSRPLGKGSCRGFGPAVRGRHLGAQRQRATRSGDRRRRWEVRGVADPQCLGQRHVLAGTAGSAERSRPSSADPLRRRGEPGDSHREHGFRPSGQAGRKDEARLLPLARGRRPTGG